MISRFIREYVQLTDEEFEEYAPVFYTFRRIKNLVHRNEFTQLPQNIQDAYLTLYKDLSIKYYSIVAALVDLYHYDPDTEGLFLNSLQKEIDIFS